jgi:glucose-6-phosphate 1-dehydrogenase
MADKPPACLFVIIGATGDLMRRKLLPAPYPLTPSVRNRTDLPSVRRAPFELTWIRE